MKKYLLLIIIVLAFALRFWKLDSYPAFNADEAALGYNAYSLLETGKDEHGNSWPVHFQSFNDFKPGGYVYLVIPFVKIFGLNEWSVRIPGAIFGVLAVYAIYLLVNELFKNKKLALISALFLAISPWHIHFSRGGWEVNVATTFMMLGIYLTVSFAENKKWINRFYAALFFILAMYTYHAARVIVPLILVGIDLVYWKQFEAVKNIKKYGLIIFISLILLTPLAVDLLKPEAVSRAAGVGLFADPGPLSRIEEQRTEQGDFTSLPAKIMHNKLVNYGLAFLENWSEHYHGLFLFLSGDDIQRNKVPETGQMYLHDLLFVLVGLWILIKGISNKSNKFILFWLLIAPVAAALTFQSPHALRAQNMVIPLIVVSSLGFECLFNLITSKKSKVLIWTILILITWQFLRYEHMYWVHMAKEYPFSSQYGVKELVNYLENDGKDYKDIVITDRYDQPYILYLFYTKYDPVKFQKEHALTARDGYGFSTVRDFGNLHFYSIKFEEMRTKYPNSLIIGTPEEIPDEGNIIKKIYGSNGYNYFDIVAN